MKAIASLLVLSFLLLFSNIQAAAVLTSGAQEVAISKEHLSRKEKKQLHKLEKQQLKKAKKAKTRKSKFGRIGLLIILGGVISLLLTDVLFLLALLTAAVFGIIGLIKDEKKTAAMSSGSHTGSHHTHCPYSNRLRHYSRVAISGVWELI